jgi:tetratricopeptide (TPR) repeat protein
VPAPRSCKAALVAAFALTASLTSAAVSAQSARRPNDDVHALARAVATDHAERGEVAEREGRTLAAEHHLARAVDADRSFLAGFLGLARALVTRGRLAEALQVLDGAAHTAVTDDDSAARWARAMSALGFTDAALRALLAREETARTRRLLAELCAASGRLPEALAHARRAHELSEGDPVAERECRRLARALAILVGEGDPVRAPGANASALRRWLAR